MENKEYTTIQWKGNNFDRIMQFVGDNGGHKLAYEDACEGAYKTGKMLVKTSEGYKEINKTDWVVKYDNGVITICKDKDLIDLLLTNN